MGAKQNQCRYYKHLVQLSTAYPACSTLRAEFGGNLAAIPTIFESTGDSATLPQPTNSKDESDYEQNQQDPRSLMGDFGKSQLK